MVAECKVYTKGNANQELKMQTDKEKCRMLFLVLIQAGI